MKSYDVIGYTYDGAAFCDDCKPTVRDDESADELGVIFAENDFETIGTTCDACRRCYTGAGWMDHSEATNAAFTLWSKCSSCNTQRPHERAYAADESRELSTGGCVSCGKRGTVRLIPHQVARA